MPISSVSGVLTLLEKANEKGVRISCADDALVVNTAGGRTVDADLIAELKASKHDLLEYFRSLQRPGSEPMLSQKDDGAPIDYRGRKYWEVIPSLYYWLDDRNLEYKAQLKCRVLRKISGSFDPAIFDKAVGFLLRRHESLRASFVRIADKFYMSVAPADSPLYAVDYRDLRQAGEDVAMDPKLIYWEGHSFDVENGPLFLVRLIRTGENDHLLTMKLHHAVYDGWSIEVLMRDLAIAYDAFSKGLEPPLPELNFQYKDYLQFRNQLIKKNYVRQRHYWESLFDRLPGELILPGARDSGEPGAFRNAKQAVFVLSGEPLAGLNGLAGKFETSLFIILQAALKLYIYRVSGQHDLVFSMICFGRDQMPGIEDQIGYFSYTDLVRTVLDAGDSFSDVVRKVKRSNNDLKENNIYPLVTFLEGMMPQGKPLNTAVFWKIDVGYADKLGFALDSSENDDLIPSGLVVDYVNGAREELFTDQDLKINFLNYRHRVDIMVQYDSNRYDEPAIAALFGGYMTFMTSLVSETLIGELLRLEDSTTLFLESVKRIKLKVQLESQTETFESGSCIIKRVTRLFFETPQSPVLYCISYLRKNELTETEYRYLVDGNLPIGRLFMQVNDAGEIRKTDISATLEKDADIAERLNVGSDIVHKKMYDYWIGNRKIGHIVEFFNKESLSRV